MMKFIYVTGIAMFLSSCGSIEERIEKDMKEHCECISEKGFTDQECLDIMESIALKYQDEPNAAELIRTANTECGKKMNENGKDDTSVRVR